MDPIIYHARDKICRGEAIFLIRRSALARDSIGFDVYRGKKRLKDPAGINGISRAIHFSGIKTRQIFMRIRKANQPLEKSLN